MIAVENDRVVVESDEFDALVAEARSDLEATTEVMYAVPTMPSIWSFWAPSSALIFWSPASWASVSATVCNKLYGAAGFVDRLLHRLLAQRGVGVDQ